MRFGGLIAAIIFAAIMAVIVLRMSANDKPAQNAASAAPPVQSVSIYVATQSIPIGATINESMVTTQAWPEHLMLNGFMRTDGTKSPVGMVARAPFQMQEPILSSKVANAQDPNFLAGSLPKGMRVITIQTNEIEGLAGFVFPGDRVDILLTHDVQKWVTAPGSSDAPREVTDAVTETLLTNVTVLAVDQRASGGDAVDDKGTLKIPQSVSLMVSPTDAQRLRLGAREGTLTLALRSLEDRESADPLIITGIQDISQYNGQTTAVDAATAGTSSRSAGDVLVIRGTRVDAAAPAQNAPAFNNPSTNASAPATPAPQNANPAVVR